MWNVLSHAQIRRHVHDDTQKHVEIHIVPFNNEACKAASAFVFELQHVCECQKAVWQHEWR